MEKMTIPTSIFFSIFTRAAGSSEMRLKKIDVGIVFIANDVIVAMATLYRNADNVTSLFDASAALARSNTVAALLICIRSDLIQNFTVLRV